MSGADPRLAAPRSLALHAVRDLLRDQLQTSLGVGLTIVRELGGGGMSRVFVARDEALGRDVVVKVLAPELAEGLSAERFAREIRLAAGLQEPHIVPVLSAGVTAQGLPYFTMPYVRGESLRARLMHGTVASAEAIAILHDVARALAYAHRQGVVHRDIKPENVLLHEGTAVVADFGIAKALHVSRTHAPDGPAAVASTLTQQGISLGTPAYMAPEQAAGDPATDHRADLYAWGVVAYELLAGTHPFADKTSPQQLMAAHFTEIPAPLSTPPVPPALADLVARCMAKDPADRPATADAVLAVLDNATHGGLRRGARPAPVSRAAFAGAVLVALALAGGAFAWRAQSERRGGEAEAPGLPLLAVLPFEMAGVAGGVAPDSAFADGLGDAITGKLARLSGLRVIDRASVRSIKDAAARPQAAGRMLGADYVLRATLRWARGADGQARVQVSPVLVRVTDGTTRWAGEPTVVAPADAFTVQGTLAIEVAEALDVALAPAERQRLATALTRDTVAFAAVERGRRIMQASDSIPLQQRLRRALLEFEAAYEREPAAATGWAEASYVLQRMGQVASSTTLIDSAAVLARAALALDPGNAQAVNTIAIFESAHARIQAYRAVIERAVRAHPSSAELRVILALVQYETGQADRAWPSALAALHLAPRSTHVIDRSLRVALALRRYGDARELVARRQALEPTSAISDAQATQVAAVVGDTSGVARAVRAYQAKGGQLLASSVPFNYLRLGDRANRDMLLTGTPATFGALDSFDTLRVYMEQMNLLMQRGDSARARPLLAHALALTARIANAAPPRLKATLGLQVAWFAAARGDRAAANMALTSYANTYAAELRDAPGGIEDAVLTCTRAEVAGLVGDVAAMLAPLRQCLTMPNGYDLVTLRTELAFTRHAADPRLRALAAELAAAEERARNTPVQTSR